MSLFRIDLCLSVPLSIGSKRIDLPNFDRNVLKMTSKCRTDRGRQVPIDSGNVSESINDSECYTRILNTTCIAGAAEYKFVVVKLYRYIPCYR